MFSIINITPRTRTDNGKAGRTVWDRGQRKMDHNNTRKYLCVLREQVGKW